jgi:hypothetical protein
MTRPRQPNRKSSPNRGTTHPEVKTRYENAPRLEDVAIPLTLPVKAESSEDSSPRAEILLLLSALNDPDAEVRYAAAKDIGDIDRLLKLSDRRFIEASIVPALIAALKDSDTYVSNAAHSSLLRIGTPQELIPSLIADLSNSETLVRKGAVKALSTVFDHPDVVAPALISALKDPQEDVRYEAAFALEICSKPGLVIPALISALKDSDLYVRRNAALALRTLLKKDFEGKAEPQELAIHALFEVLSDPTGVVRSVALETLCVIGAPSELLVPILTTVLRDPEEGVLHGMVLEQLERIGGPPELVAPALISKLKSADKDWRIRVIKLLGKIGRPKELIIPALIAALNDESPAVVEHAVLALRETQSKHSGDKQFTKSNVYDNVISIWREICRVSEESKLESDGNAKKGREVATQDIEAHRARHLEEFLKSLSDVPDELLEELARLQTPVRNAFIQKLQPAIRTMIQVNPPESVAGKQALAKRLNIILAQLGLAVRHPHTSQACSISAVGGSKAGYFVLQAKRMNPPTVSSKSAPKASRSHLLLNETVPPIELIEAPRQERFSDRNLPGRK